MPNFPNDEQRILKLLSDGYVIPADRFEPNALQNIINCKFIIDDKPIKLIKNYSFEYEKILSVTIDSRFRYNVDEIIF